MKNVITVVGGSCQSKSSVSVNGHIDLHYSNKVISTLLTPLRSESRRLNIENAYNSLPKHLV